MNTYLKLLTQTVCLFLAANSTLFAQMSLPGADDMFSSLSGDGKPLSISETVKEVMSIQRTKTPTENTMETVKTAQDADGPLVVEETIPAINKEVVEAIDPKTKRYPPRVQLNFKEFPLRTIARKPATGSQPISDWTATQDFSGKPIKTEAQKITDRIRDRTGQKAFGIEFQGRRARLFGSVETERQKELAEIMLRFEPGIDSIKNELVVRSDGELSTPR